MFIRSVFYSDGTFVQSVDNFIAFILLHLAPTGLAKRTFLAIPRIFCATLYVKFNSYGGCVMN
ncbi:hypothetical protein BWR16_13480, partial [Vibrio sp. V01_P9A10T6]